MRGGVEDFDLFYRPFNPIEVLTYVENADSILHRNLKHILIDDRLTLQKVDFFSIVERILHVVWHFTKMHRKLVVFVVAHDTKIDYIRLEVFPQDLCLKYVIVTITIIF